ncbi:EboA domain-containing protein [Streptomyces sporangiiformans]|uniref:EboA domain-containing protein n=1 Tax=Streptomyces sporangiiformans TaxID=2315329 RepID=UPI0015E76BD4|nr:EboA domain-containing protein [Streptomyces sporangiiformans]
MAVTTPNPSAPADPRPALPAALTPQGRAWLDEATARPTAIRALFPAVRRRCGHTPLTGHRTVDEAARAVLLTALPLRGPALADELTRLHHHGDPAEQRAVLRALPLLDPGGPDGAGDLGDLALPLLREALRGNDNTLIEAALGPYAAAHLPDAVYRQAVLSCVFCEIPLDRVAGLGDRADVELARMLADFARERIVAGRAVPEDILPIVRSLASADAAALYGTDGLDGVT